MKKILRTTAAIAALGTVITWAALGANRGWTKTSREVKTTDPVTGLDGITYEKRFAPGLDFLAVGLAVGAALAGTSFLIKTKNNYQPSATK